MTAKQMQNVEIKARCSDLQAAEETARRLGARFQVRMRQVDTYFRVRRGRLKLREFDRGESQLIYYERPDAPGSRLSDYELVPVADGAALKAALQRALGVRCVVDKRRTLYLYDEVRIHLDQVEGLGAFIELEGVLSPSAARHKVEEKVAWLSAELGIQEADLIAGSYADLLGDGLST